MNKIHQTFRKKIHKTLKIIHQIKENIAPNNYNYFPKLVSHQTWKNINQIQKNYTKLKKKVTQNLKLFTPNPKAKNNTPN